MTGLFIYFVIYLLILIFNTSTSDEIRNCDEIEKLFKKYVDIETILQNDGLITFPDSLEDLEDGSIIFPNSSEVSEENSEYNGKYYNYTFDVSFVDGFNAQKFIHIYLKVPENITFPYEASENPIPFFIPNFDVEVLNFNKSESKKFLRISGKRCQWKCDNASKECEVSKCWEENSFCSGEIEKCLELDDGSTCIDTNLKQDPDFSSTYFGNLFGFGYTEITLDHTNSTQKISPISNFWECDLTKDSQVSCFTKVDTKYDIKCLKTICG